MEFHKKIDALLTLTSTTNAKLAAAINLDRSQISRMRTGARERPKKNDTLRLMAKYFAKRCLNESQISSLEKLTYDYRIRMDVSTALLETIIFEWLCADENVPQLSNTKRFVYQINQFPSKDSDAKPESIEEDFCWLPQNKDVVMYRGNSGKRQATIDFFNILLSSPSEQRLLISSDERNEWLFEDHHFTEIMSAKFQACVKKVNSSAHILTSNQDLDTSLYTVRHWLSSYMHGNLRQYYYPMHRDKLHRQTVFVIPGVAALYSGSLSTQTESYITILTTVSPIVDSYEKEFYDLLIFCKPVTTMYIPEMEETLFSRMQQIQAESMESIFKFSSLPFHSFPREMMERICKQADTPLANKVFQNYLSGAQSRQKSMQTHPFVDIIKLAPIEQIKLGKAEIPDCSFFSNPRYYTPDCYKKHLQHIVDDLKRYPNYDVVISESSDIDSLVLYGIGSETAIIVQQSAPYAVIEINEPSFASSFIEFLQRFAKKEKKNKTKQDVIETLTAYMRQI